MADPTHLQNRRKGKGRHRLLGNNMLTGNVYRHLKISPGLTIAQIHSALKGNRQSINGALQRLKAAGLVDQKPQQKGNRVIRPYYAVVENETGFERDTVEIETTIFVNAFGEYSAVSRIVNELPGARMAAGLHPVHVVTHTAVVPKPDEPYRTRQIFDPGFKGGMEPGQKTTTLIIDAEPVHIEDK